MVSIVLRPMQFDDLVIVTEIENAAHIAPWSKAILEDCLRVGYVCWVLLENNVIQGFAMLTIGADEGHIVNVCVRPKEQGRGLGQCLIRKLLEIAKEKHLQTLFLEVRASNKSAIHLYEKFGFNQIDVRKAYYPAKPAGREDAFVYALEF